MFSKLSESGISTIHSLLFIVSNPGHRRHEYLCMCFQVACEPIRALRSAT